MKTRKIGPLLARVVLAGSVATVAVGSDSARSQSVADFYKGKTVSVVIGYPAGGGFDVSARLLMRHMPRHLPGNPTMVAKNMPGAGSVRAANYLYSVAPKDGTEFGIIGPARPVRAIVEPRRRVVRGDEVQLARQPRSLDQHRVRLAWGQGADARCGHTNRSPRGRYRGGRHDGDVSAPDECAARYQIQNRARATRARPISVLRSSAARSKAGSAGAGIASSRTSRIG